jgi:DNA-directed RNA polymerase subunit RPC12/RpoP
MTIKCHCGKSHKVHGASLDYMPATIECPECEHKHYLIMMKGKEDANSKRSK